MSPSRSAQLSAVVKAIRENLQLLQESKAELLEAIQETDEMADELRRHIEEARRLMDDIAE